LVWPAWRKRLENPEAWFTEVLKSIRDSRTDIRRRIALISWLGEESDLNDPARLALKDLLVRDRLPVIRAACAEALERAASSDLTIAKVLVDRLDKDRSEQVRERCAEALRGVAPNQTEIRVRLEQLFASGPELVRAGAARGLSQLDFTSSEQKALLDQFQTTIASVMEPARVRRASIWTVASLLGREDMADIQHLVEECLDDHDPTVSRAALHVLADAITEGQKEWPQALIDRIETMLMAVPDPCPHLVGDLMMIAAMKELHGGRSLERTLVDALTSCGDLIKIAFVYGSVARLEQIRESDIDLMVVGDVRLKDLAVALHTAEQTLGRTINPVLFAPDKFRVQYREGNPFLLDIVRKGKIFLKGSRDELTELVADRSVD
jgi:predicted nucleotidyltransferase